MSEQSDEVLQALGEKVRTAITVVSEIAEVVARHRMDKARDAQAASEAQRAEIAARLRAERDGAMPVMRQPWDSAWWRRAEPQEIAHVWQVTSGWAAADDPYAKTTLEHMRRQIQQRYGVSVPDQPAGDKELAMLLTPLPQAEQTSPGAGAVPEFQEGVQGSYEYVVRDAANPDAPWLAQGSPAADPGAVPADVAVQGLREYAQGGPDRGATQEERLDRLFDVAYGRVSPARDLSNVVIDVYQAGQLESGRSTPLYSLEGARMEEVRAERRAERQRVIDGQSEASDEEVLAAIALEARATREDLRYEQARAAAAGREPGQQVTWSISEYDFVNEADVSRQVATGTDVVPPGMSPELFAAEQLMHRVGAGGRVRDSYSILVVRAEDGAAQLAHIGGRQVEAIRAAQLPAYEAARAAGAGVDVRAVEQAQAELATTTEAARERMGELRLRREMAEARIRGESDEPVMWAERLRHDLDEGWWETASPAEIAGVWEHVGTWPDGASKTAARAHLEAGVQRTHGVTVPHGASAGDVAAVLEKVLDAQGQNLPEDRQDERLRQRSQDEEAAATASGERAVGMATVGEPVEDVRAEAEQAAAMRAAAAQDREAAAALADMGDREAADAVAVAAQGFSGTPSSRLAASQGKKRTRRPQPPRQSRDQEQGRGGR
ncbi:hypothetical protein E2C11_07455 [Streptomyces lavendulae]|nr:hypothetical protein [Streptomyces lavendulae]TXJ83300.1 hypothetical protein E2C11_07455 [Streptomyces lavendulae]